MAGDLLLLIGKWTVKVKQWTWEYDFFDDGQVKWHDVHSPEKGVGIWTPTPKLVNMSWVKSTTRESWQRPLTTSNDHTWYQSSYFIGKYKIAKVGGPGPSGANDAIVIDRAYEASRASLRHAINRLRALQTQLAAVDSGSGGPHALERLKAEFKRDIAVLSLRLFVPKDPTNQAFRDALTRSISLFERNLVLPKSIFAARGGRKCANPRSAFAWTTPNRTPPDTDVCTSWFESSEDLRRDVITHEYFHTIGLEDISVNSTGEAFRNANTMAQVVAFLFDRTRQVQSDGFERAHPALPSP